MATMIVRLDRRDADLVRRCAKLRGETISDFVRSTLLEKIEDSFDLQELREAIAHDSGERFSIDETLREFA